VDGNLVYCSSGEDNPEGGPTGRIICVDASQVDPKTKTPKLVWEKKGRKCGLSSGAVTNGMFYMPEDSGTLLCYDAKTGKEYWGAKYATEVRGAPLVADGRIYIFDVKARLVIMTIGDDPKKEPDPDLTFEYKFKDPKGLLIETNATPVAVNGHVYVMTRNDTYCLGTASPGTCGEYKPLAEEAKYDPAAVATARIYPADVTAKPGETIKFDLVLMDANGRQVKGALQNPKGEWTMPLPPKAKDFQPPALDGKITGGFGPGAVELSKKPAQQSYVDFVAENPKLSLRARVRVVMQMPINLDFEKALLDGVPPGWINAQGKYAVKKLPDGTQALYKVNTSSVPAIAKTNAYLTLPEATDYTIQADLMGSEVRAKLPDMGIVNCRYSLIMDGKTDPTSGKRQLRLTSWEARAGGRVNSAVDFDWKKDTWYTAKLVVTQTEKTALIKAKLWERGTPEPAKWTIEFEDPNPNRAGAAAIYGYISNVGDGGQPGSAAWYDNIKVTPNK
jgi:hypothetical protein